MKKRLTWITTAISCRVILLLTISLLSVTAFAQIPYICDFDTNLGNFVNGGNNNSSNYNVATYPAATSSQGTFAIIANPNLMNEDFYINHGDHTTGTGNMMVVDGGSNPSQIVWAADNSNSITGLIVGNQYTFTYWILNVNTDPAANSLANIQIVKSDGTGTSTVQSNTCPANNTWTEVTYTWVAAGTWVKFWLLDAQTALAGNDFALDDLSITAVPPPLALKYSVNNPSCPNSNNGFISVYGYGGYPPYTYSLNGGPFSANSTFNNLSASSNNYVSIKDATSTIVSSASNINIVNPVNPLTISPNTTICSGAHATLSASGGTGGYTWTSNPVDASLTTPNSATITVSPVTTTTYTVTSSTITTPNLVYNPGFELGDVGFNTDYIDLSASPYNSSKIQDAYGIVTSGQTFESTFGACVDHTTGTGNMMVVDGATASGQMVWGQSIPVQTNTTYTFSYWIESMDATSPAVISLLINGVAITPVITAPSTACTWQEASFSWNSAANTTAQISLVDNNIIANGNDFALDDISFSATTTCPITDSTKIIVITSPIPVTGFSYTTPVCANGTNPVPSGVVGFAAGGTFSSTAGLTINASTGVIDLSTSTPGSYTVTYSVPASGCSIAGSSTTPITISNTITPVTGFSYTTPVCANGTNPVPAGVAGFTTGGTYSSTAGLTINSSTGVIDLSTSTPGSYTVTYSVAGSGCTVAGSSTTPITITATTSPVTGFSYTTPVCANGTNPVPAGVAGFTTGGTYSSTAGLTINSSTGVIDLSTSTPGSYTVTYSVAASGCIVAGSSTTPITITATTSPVTGFSYTTPVCANGTNPVPTVVAGFTTGGTYSSTAGLTINSSTGVIDLTTSTPGSYTVTYSVAASGCMVTGSSTTPITISNTITPVTGFSYTTPVCANGTNPIPAGVAGFTTGGTYSSTAGLTINSSTGVIDLSTSTPGSYTVTYSVAASGCIVAGSSTTPITITGTTSPVTGFSYTTPVCANGANPVPAGVAGFTTGGTYSSTAGLTINSSTGVIDLSTSTPGSYTVTYSVAASGCMVTGSSTTPITITGTTSPVTGFSYTTPVCANGTNPAPSGVAGFTTGGTYSSTAGLTINSSTGVIDLSTSTPGSYTVTYSVAASGCMVTGSSTTQITISNIITPVTGFSYTTPVCANGTNPIPAGVAGFTTGGTYSSTAGLTINSSTGVIDLSTSTPGSYTVTYSVVASGCIVAGSSTTPITITGTTSPVTGFSYTTPVCANGTNPIPAGVAGFTTGGTYSSTAGLTINSSTGVIDLSTSTPGSYTVTYSVAASGCMVTGSSTTPITISNTITPVTGFSYTTPVCANGANPVPAGVAGFTTGGTYSSTAGLTINSSTGVIDLSTSTPGSYTVTYSVAASGCMVTGSSTTPITISNTITPVTGFSYTTPVCANGTNPVPAGVAGFTTGGTYSSTAGLTINSSTGVIDLSTSTPGSYTVTYSVAASGCTVAGSSTTPITITGTTSPVTEVFYTTPVCANGTNPVPTVVAGFTTGGTYSSTAGLTINSSTGVIDLSTSTPGSYIVTYSVAASGCMVTGSSTTPITITGTTSPVTGFSYTTPVCANGVNPVPAGMAGFIVGGTYSSTAGLTINASTGVIDLSTSTPGSYTVTYSVAASGCMVTGSSTAPITINSITVPVTAFSYTTPVCANGTNPVPTGVAGFTTGGTYSSITGLSLNSSTGVIDLSTSTPGSYTVTYSIAASGCMVTGSSNSTILINTLPAVPSVVTGSHCGSGIVNLSASGIGQLSWYSDLSLSTLVNNGTSYSPMLSSTTYFYVTATSDNCTSMPAQVLAIIEPLPDPPDFSSGLAICPGDSLILNPGMYYSYLWQDNSILPTFTVTSPGTYSVTVGSPAGCTNSGSVTVGTLSICDDIYFPSAFTPNGDGLNDYFFALGNLVDVKNYALYIYNRWGQLLFTTTDPYQKWDGTYSGSKCDIGDYVWRASYTYKDKNRMQQGNLVLIR